MEQHMFVDNNGFDVPILLTFYKNKNRILKAITAIRKIKPSIIYFFQDGPDMPNDEIELKEARDFLFSLVDWKCNIKTKYLEKDYGAVAAGYLAQRWLFDNEELGIILEDDNVPSISFFLFCREMLYKYKDDKRINLICGSNNNLVSDINESYLFTKKGALFGWATWKRVVDKWDPTYSWLNDKRTVSMLKDQFLTKREYKHFIEEAEKAKQHNVFNHEIINGACEYLNNTLNIVPKYNLVSNIGIDSAAQDAPAKLALVPKLYQHLYFQKAYEIDFPLIHPNYVVRDYEFERRMTISNWEYFWIPFEVVVRRILFSRK
jgi:hypothetical protein